MRTGLFLLIIAALLAVLGEGSLPVRATPLAEATLNTVAGVVNEEFGQATFTAQSDAQRQLVSGYVRSQAADGSVVEGPVYCLTISGNRATLGVHLTQGSAGMQPGYVLYFVEDRGHGQPQPDTL